MIFYFFEMHLYVFLLSDECNRSYIKKCPGSSKLYNGREWWSRFLASIYFPSIYRKYSTRCGGFCRFWEITLKVLRFWCQKIDFIVRDNAIEKLCRGSVVSVSAHSLYSFFSRCVHYISYAVLLLPYNVHILLSCSPPYTQETYDHKCRITGLFFCRPPHTHVQSLD